MKIVVLAGEQVQNVLSPLHQEQEYVRHYDRKDIRRFLWIFFAALRMWTGRIRFRQNMMWTQHQNICQHLMTGLNR